jgi:hypothetical protein
MARLPCTVGAQRGSEPREVQMHCQELVDRTDAVTVVAEIVELAAPHDRDQPDLRAVPTPTIPLCTYPGAWVHIVRRAAPTRPAAWSRLAPYCAAVASIVACEPWPV